MVTGEVISVQEKADPAASLIADRGVLRRTIGFGEQDVERMVNGISA